MSIVSNAKFKRGFTLIEILISMVIVAIGLLGLAGMQLQGLQNNQRSFFRTQATQFASDMSDRMRSNPNALTVVLGVPPIAGAIGGFNNRIPALPLAVDCLVAICTSSEMAEYDLDQWNTSLASRLGLPLGVGVVCIDSTPADGSVAVGGAVTDDCDDTGFTYVIKVWWDDSKSGNASQRFVMSIEP